MRILRLGALAMATVIWSHISHADPVPVMNVEGTLHGFLLLSTLDGKPIADGDLTQTTQSNRVTMSSKFRFKDGSIHEETAVFSQHTHFKLITYRLVQKGPSFPKPLEMSIDTASGKVTVSYANEKGEKQVINEQMTIPPDLANGMVATLLKNLPPQTLPKTLSIIAATPKPILVTLQISAGNLDKFHLGSSGHSATNYDLKVDIGGLKGLLAKIFGKQPPDSHVWIFGSDVPAFVKAESQFYSEGPIWRTELVSPVWSK
jgi:hypothetical protein